MRIVIEKPTFAYLYNTTPEEIEVLKTQFAFENGKIGEILKRHKRNMSWKRKDEDGWEQHKWNLEAQLHDNVVKEDSKGHYIRPASISYIEGIEYTVENKIAYPELKPLPWIHEPEFTPYPYQYESIKKLLEIGHGNVALPTGCGKSFILLYLARVIGKSVVVVTPSRSIFRELLTEFQKMLGKSNVGGYGDGLKDIKKPITIAIGRSITMLKKDTPQWDFFAAKENLLVDESHTWGADGLESISHGVLADAKRRFFMSATQTRGDGTIKLLQSIIGKTVVEMSIQEAIDKKYLCPLKFYIKNLRSLSTAANRSPIERSRKTRLNERDPLDCKRRHFLYNTEIADFYAQIANAMWSVEGESTLILVEELSQIQMLVERLKVPFSYVHSGSKKDAAKWGLEKVDSTTEIERFNRGEVRVLIGTKAIATGTNMYPTHNTCNWIGGSSEILTKQGPMGRSTRWMKKKYAEFHKPKTHTKIWDVDVMGQQILGSMLKRRKQYYEETGETVTMVA